MRRQAERRPSPQARKLEKELGHTAVCLIGTTKRVPREFGDNRGVWPVKFATTMRPRSGAKVENLANPIHKVVVHQFVFTPSKDDAKRLRERLDSLLVGDSAESKLRHGWRDVEDPDVVWNLLLAEALRELHLDVFDEAGRQSRLKRELDRRAGRIRRGR